MSLKVSKRIFLSRLLGLSKASDILSCEDVTAEEAKKLGIVDKVVPSGELNETALKIAQELVQKPVHSLAGIKRLLNCNIGGLRDCLECENRLLLRIVNRPDFQKNLARYTEGHF